MKFQDMVMKDVGFKWVLGTLFKLLLCTCLCLVSNSNNIVAEDPYFYGPPPSYVNVSHQSWKVGDITSLLNSEGTYPSFALGFVSYGSSNVLAILMEPKDEVVWCANGGHPVGDDATLDLTSEQGLVLRDEDGNMLWSTKTSNLSARSIHLQDDGNLVLLDAKGNTIWESFDYPTDTLLDVKQGLHVGQRLTSSNSTSNFSAGMYYVKREYDGLHAYVDLNPPQEYRFLDYNTYDDIVSQRLYYASNYSFDLSYMHLTETGRLKWINMIQSYPDGNYSIDLFEDYEFGVCAYPTTCGNYGICVNNETMCVCPMETDEGGINYFQPSNAYNLSLGCSLVNPIACPDTHNLHHFLELQDVGYFDSTPSLTGTDVESCKSACLHQCSCKAVIFHYHNDTSFGNCTLPSVILTLKYSGGRYNVITFIKVQKQKKTSSHRNLVLSVSASLIVLVLVTGVFAYVFMKKGNRAKDFDSSYDVFVDTVTRFSFEALKLATQDFQTKLGRGGFGSVFEGTLDDGTKVAVKRLDSLGQGRKEFLAEVNTIGSVHHFNLVRLLGFCDDGLNRLLVYEYMCNGSLEKWIFNQDISLALTWSVRQKIIHGVAAGLEYLHTHCKQNVIHFDIKPQNILLDKDFNIKISDFGLAKMVDRDQSQVMTMVRGTPGYMAPELVTGRAISVKVDVYSFGVLVLEIVCGRKNFGSSEGDCLTNLVKVKADADQLSDLIDEQGEGMQQHKEEAVKIMKIAIWCLQRHFIRPTMSMVVKVLQDLPNMEALSDLSYLTMVQEAAPAETNYDFSVRPTESLLSGPR
ncbi:G-type lectin S-receptor-like serine/threonine-protein kinase SD2-5 [Chenopodium quinoa]|uniref:G-type lectin S-receptor-like serine/threonine-protein kinase SD2-5 n=1 Tax=Chenopodium quinoa TaxID=63459 RepID=UPI000B7844F5|nr:G-type lectin S-receptor-like serine/threonine-protein kinase SD2-5 [Chenopodium quinoa]